ncbi:MAG: hypothetical protein CMM49_09535 [Rhodospirillaceae bacterium]|nr:hypothetical protein [Rhodospirillaceae bacterium]|tara:strand:- start:36365 stop:36766 length:402 start_codon:yes stop_codon:yes gene_type:complete
MGEKFSIVTHLKNKGIEAELGKIKGRTTIREKSKIVARNARKQLSLIESATYTLKKSDWISEESSGTCLLSIRYKNQLIPLDGKETKIRLPNRVEAVKALRQIAIDLEEGLLDNLLENVKERQRKHKGGNVGF